MGMFFNRKKKVVEEIDNEYALNKMQLGNYTRMNMVNREYIEVTTTFYPKCDKKFCFLLNWNDISDKNIKKGVGINVTKFIPREINSPTIQLSYKVFPDCVSDAEIKVWDVSYDIDCCPVYRDISLGKFCDFKKILEDQYDLPNDIKRFFFKVIKLIDFKKDINFVRKFADDKDEFERKLKHINYKESKLPDATDITKKVKQIDEQISKLKAERDILTKEQLNTFKDKKNAHNPLDEYIARQEKQKRK